MSPTFTMRPTVVAHVLESESLSFHTPLNYIFKLTLTSLIFGMAQISSEKPSVKLCTRGQAVKGKLVSSLYMTINFQSHIVNTSVVDCWRFVRTGSYTDSISVRHRRRLQHKLSDVITGLTSWREQRPSHSGRRHLLIVLCCSTCVTSLPLTKLFVLLSQSFLFDHKGGVCYIVRRAYMYTFCEHEKDSF